MLPILRTGDIKMVQRIKQDPRLYPSCKISNIPTPETEIYSAGTSGEIDLSAYTIIKLASAAAATLTAVNPIVGQDYIFQQDATGVELHAVTFTGMTLNVAGATTLTTNADDESLILRCISSTEFIIIANNGSVALS